MSVQDQLRKLYLLEKQVRGMRSRLDAAQRRHRAQQGKLEQLRSQLGELQQQQKHAQAKAGELENESNAVELRIAKLREQMNSVTSNKEYSALLVEVNTLKLEKGKYEDEALGALNDAESLAQAVADKQAEVDGQDKLVSGAVKDVEEARADVGDELDRLVTQRDEAAEDVPDDVLATFQEQAENHDGEAMAHIIEENKRRMEYACGGCYMHLPPERVNSVMIGGNDITTCPCCGRILYLEPDGVKEPT